MSRVTLHLPPQAKVTGALRSRAKLHNLDQDMLQIELPGSIFIDVGWYPDLDQTGEYRLIVFHDTTEEMLERLATSDVDQVKAAIYRMVEKYLPYPTVFVNGRAVPSPPPVIDSVAQSNTRLYMVKA